MNGFELARAYQKGELCGWLETRKPGLVKQQYNLFPFNFSRPAWLNNHAAYADAKCMLYLICRKVLGQDTPNYPQLIGDCVSFGAKNGAEYTTCTAKFLRGERLKYRAVFPPYYYGTGRIYVGGQENDYEDGSLGSWMANAVQKYGTLFSDDQGVPAYSANVAKDFGAKRSTLDKFKPIAIDNPIKRIIPINSWEDLVTTICQGIPCPTASGIGYDMEASNDGFHRQTTQWSHQMAWIGVSQTPEPYAILLNNWGDCHGHLKDFDDGHDIPVGCLRVRRKDVEKHIREKETYGYADFAGEQERRIDKLLFNLF